MVDGEPDIEPEHFRERTSRLEKPEQPKIPDRMLETVEDPLSIEPKPTIETRRASFEADVAEEREAMEPYLRDFVPAGTETRSSHSLESFQFRFETDNDKADIQRVLDGDGSWESVTIPDYRGPVGWWTGYYRTTFESPAVDADERVYIDFEGADYIATVYVNGRVVGNHEGFFAPFDFDITEYLEPEENVLVVEIKNEAPSKNLEKWNGPDVDGDKLYAATGPGYDDPELGWHHCPPGAGLHRPISIETRPSVFIGDCWVRPNLSEGVASVHVTVENTNRRNQDISLEGTIYSQNFEGYEQSFSLEDPEPAGPDANVYSIDVDLDSYRTWDTEDPWLYRARVSLNHDGAFVDEQDVQFGMRSFEMLTEEPTYGDLQLNGEPIRLRGANTMGHLSRAAMAEDEDQLIEDLCIARNANMNYFRFTQRPVPADVYEYCDKLGLMNQTDLPLFGYLRRSQFAEAIKQAEEMEELIRSHPSAIMVSFINEPPEASEEDLAHRHFTRAELERFFLAARQIIKTANPDRVIKNVEGDYSPPSITGLYDFHSYSTWYAHHALPVGKLHANELPKVKTNWKTGVGEYGSEGLDNWETMKENYPEEWLPSGPEAEWSPSVIAEGQTFDIHRFWYPEQTTAAEWIEASQRHQELSTKVLTDAWRRNSDRIVQTAIHILIDAWPAGWMKALVDTERRPKRAYFALQDAYEPLRVHCRTDQWNVGAGETLACELWVLNDRSESIADRTVAVTTSIDEQTIAGYQESVLAIEPTSSRCLGTVEVEVPNVETRAAFDVDAALLDDEAIETRERTTVDVWPQPEQTTATYLGERVPDRLAPAPIELSPFEGGLPETIFVDPSVLEAHHDELLDAAKAGSTVIVLRHGSEETITLGPVTIEIGAIGTIEENGLYTLACDPDHPVTSGFEADDFAYPYNPEAERIDFLCDSFIDSTSIDPIVFSYEGNWGTSLTNAGDRDEQSKTPAPVVGRTSIGAGSIVFTELRLAETLAGTPALQHLLCRLCRA